MAYLTSGNQTVDSMGRLTDEELKRITSSMTKSERKDFERRQRQAENDRMWDAMLMGELFRDDENE